MHVDETLYLRGREPVIRMWLIRGRRVPCHHRGYDKTAHIDVQWGQLTEYTAVFSRHADLFMRFAERGICCRTVLRLPTAAGKGDLPGMRSPIEGPLDQGNRDIVGGRNEKYQYRSRPALFTWYRGDCRGTIKRTHRGVRACAGKRFLQPRI